MPRPSILERIVDERVGNALVGGVSSAVDKVAEEFAKDALRDDAFRRTLKELVHRRSEALLEQLLRNGRKRRRRQ